MSISTKHLQIRAKNIIKELMPLLKKENKIIDIGCGSGWISFYLKENEFNVTLVDAYNCNETGLPMVLYQHKLPFKEKEFDVALIVSVLHHAENPEKIIEDAKRISKKVIILEEFYKSKLSKIWINFWEWVMEMELGMLKHYKFYNFYSEKQLDEMMKKHSIKITYNFLRTMRRGLYVLE